MRRSIVTLLAAAAVVASATPPVQASPAATNLDGRFVIADADADGDADSFVTDLLLDVGQVREFVPEPRIDCDRFPEPIRTLCRKIFYTTLGIGVGGQLDARLDLVDLDGDGELDIVARGQWNSIARDLDWDGDVDVFWTSIPARPTVLVDGTFAVADVDADRDDESFVVTGAVPWGHVRQIVPELTIQEFCDLLPEPWRTLCYRWFVWTTIGAGLGEFAGHFLPPADVDGDGEHEVVIVGTGFRAGRNLDGDGDVDVVWNWAPPTGG